MELKSTKDKTKISWEAFNSKYKQGKKRIITSESRAIIIGQSGEKNKNKAKWTGPKRCLGYHQHINIYIMGLPGEEKEKEAEKKILKKYCPKASQIWWKIEIYTSNNLNQL